MKLWERIIEGRLRKVISISKNPFGFMPGSSTTEAIHIIRRLAKVYRDKKKDLHMVFIDWRKRIIRSAQSALGVFGEESNVGGVYSSY